MGVAKLTAALAAIWIGAAAAATPEPAGMVKILRGTVTVDRAGQHQPATPGMTVFAGDVLRTGVQSAVGITLRDDTLVAAGPESSLLISDFRFDTTTRDGSLLVSLIKGAFSVVTGLIARQNPASARFTTPTLSLGVRGTEFIVEVDGNSP